MTSVIETIKAKIDVVEEIGLVVALQKSGKSYRGLCPFHNERTPSFHVFADSQSWHCFGCNEGGDVFTFVEKYQGLEFRDALLYLAEKAGVSVEEPGGRDPEEERALHAERERLRKLNEDALLWFHQMLLRSKEAAEARAYLQSRGITTETVVAFGIGYAPEQWDGLSKYLLARGYSERELVRGGLARERDLGKATSEVGKDGGGIYDYFRHRIIFPIRDMRGRVIGFGGRALGDGQPKYLNSPQTPLFEKNTVLYALDMARDAIKQAGQVVIVEGYVDAVIAHQYGTKQTVACIGSAITEKHIAQLKKLTKQVTLALDPDAAGMAATEHGIEEALKGFDRTLVPVPLSAGESRKSGDREKGRYSEPRGMIRLEEQVDAEINVLQLPPGEDPDEFIRRDVEAWRDKVQHPVPLIDYFFEARTAGLNLKQPRDKAEAAKRLLPVIGAISDRIRRDAYIQKLAKMISMDERSLNMELQRLLRGQKSGITAHFTERSSQRYLEGEAESKRDNGRGDGAGNTGSTRQAAEPHDVRTFGLDRNRLDRVKWEDYLIGLLLTNPELSTHVCGIINDGDFAGTDTRELYRIFNSIHQRGSSPLFQSLEQVVPSALLATLERARKSIELGPPLEGAGLEKAAVQCATRLKRARLLQLNTEIQYLVREASEAGNAEAVQQYQQQLLDIHRRLRTINTAMRLQG
ncbi:MAG TPA: DNA primase [Ktedonobacteraceae bacterium]|jgi:DNA primase|nr:DNA primase [Ktedonobacteraceae bacterium]